MKTFNIKCIKKETTNFGTIYERFLLTFFEANQALTIGGLLRRTLLGDLGGMAITEVKIKGAKHEFAPILGLREDTLEILLNLKGIVIQNLNANKTIEKGFLKIQGPTIVTANSIRLASNLKIVNLNHYIATIVSNQMFEMEFTIEYGIGYRLADYTMKSSAENSLKVDAIFMPIQRVDMKIEQFTIDESATYKEHLLLDIWSNGSISPKNALLEALVVITNLLNAILLNGLANSDIDDTEVNSLKLNADRLEKYKYIYMEQLNLSPKLYQSLKKENINTVFDILKCPLEQVSAIEGLYLPAMLSLLKNRLGIILK